MHTLYFRGALDGLCFDSTVDGFLHIALGFCACGCGGVLASGTVMGDYRHLDFDPLKR